ncbi:type VI secretion system TssO [Pedobacter punctiformis]|uniref:Type VI secretion system TssO n=1 Tax=Pedobacter punctiformis TaxID=3004097 RepID=A0ABT4L398_9SPHI|nr:type VI secretion system TssO [Pedobacter sp. HCMS5-2]MCZ4242389.1 type VI secretion system TssO [Pedobacter sp. HCMS5-2]
MKAKNIQEIYKKSTHFWLLFGVLVFFSIASVYLFFWAAQQQRAAFNNRITAYKNIVNKQITLNEKIDSLYLQMTYLDRTRVDNTLFLAKYISDNKESIVKKIGNDSTANFTIYARLTKNLNKLLLLKDSVVRIAAREELMKKDLNDCIQKNRKISSDISGKTRRSFN